jgi:hypothetical protein
LRQTVMIAVDAGLRKWVRVSPRMLVAILMMIDIISVTLNFIWFEASQTVTSSILIVSVIVPAHRER